MTIERLVLERYGHFADHELRLVADATRPGGLCVILGHNEAGKTTVLDAVRDLLFGFPVRSPYNFRYAYGELAVRATLRFADGVGADVRRVKSNTNPLTGEADGQAVDRAWLSARLAGVTREQFSSAFGFSLEELQRGGDILGESYMRDALFAASLGSDVDLSAVRRRLTEQAEALFAPRAQKPPVNECLSQLRKLLRLQRESELRAGDYTTLQEQLAELRKRCDDFARQALALREEQGLIQRVADALPRARRLADLREALDAIVIPEGFAHPNPAEILQFIGQSVELQQQIEGQNRRLAELKGKIAQTAQVAPGALEHASRIDELTSRIAHYKKAMEDLPERTHERDQLVQNVTERLTDARPGWSVEDLKARRPDVRTRHAFESLAGRWEDLQGQRQRLEGEVQSYRKTKERAEQALQEETPDATIDSVRALAAQRDRYESTVTRLAEQSESCEGLRAALAAKRDRLRPLVDDGTPSPERLPVPRAEQVSEMTARLADLCARLQGQHEALQRTVTAREDEERRLRVEFDGDLPTEEGLRELRASRDARWAGIRQAWEQGLTEDLAQRADAFVDSVIAADAYVDGMRERAETVALRERLLRSVAAFRTTEEDIAGRIEALDEERGRLNEEWLALFAECGFEPLAPAAMQQWLADHERYVRAEAGLAEAAAPLSTAREQLAELERQAREVMDDTDASVGELLLRAQNQVQAHLEAQAERKQAEAAMRKAEDDLRTLEGQLSELATEEAQWAEEWAQCSAQLGLGDVQIAPARCILAILEQLHTELKQLPDLDRRIDLMRTEAESFEAEARALCEACASDLLSAPPAAAAVGLRDLLESAKAAKQRIEGYQEEDDRLESELGELRTQRERTEEALTKWRAAAQAPDDAALAEVARRAQERIELQRQIDSLEADIAETRRRGATEGFDRALGEALEQDTTVDALQQRADALRRDAGNLEEERSRTDQEIGRLDQELCRTLEASGASSVAQDLEAVRAELVAHAERYAVLALAGALLEDEVRRFEREEQHEALERISGLFRRLTGGRYAHVLPGLGQDARLRVLSAGNSELEPDQLSTGTREQLYLAIRLAYVEQYCASAEPLPLVLDDVLVNFDDDRAAAALSTLDEIASRQQVLFFTCHRHLVALAQQSAAGCSFAEIPAPNA